MVVEGRSIARGHYPIMAGKDRIGTVTSGTLSPTLDRNIAMGYVTVEFSSPGQVLHVDIRGTPTEAEVALLPFYTRPPSTRNVTT
jgi:aminomethyltransferase